MELIGPVKAIDEIFRLKVNASAFQRHGKTARVKAFRQKEIQGMRHPVAEPAAGQSGATAQLCSG